MNPVWTAIRSPEYQNRPARRCGESWRHFAALWFARSVPTVSADADCTSSGKFFGENTTSACFQAPSLLPSWTTSASLFDFMSAHSRLLNQYVFRECLQDNLPHVNVGCYSKGRNFSQHRPWIKALAQNGPLRERRYYWEAWLGRQWLNAIHLRPYSSQTQAPPRSIDRHWRHNRDRLVRPDWNGFAYEWPGQSIHWFHSLVSASLPVNCLVDFSWVLVVGSSMVSRCLRASRSRKKEWRICVDAVRNLTLLCSTFSSRTPRNPKVILPFFCYKASSYMIL